MNTGPGRGPFRPGSLASCCEPPGVVRSAAITGAPAATATVTLGLAAAARVVSVRQMNGMDMGVATRLGSLTSFITGTILEIIGGDILVNNVD